MNVKNIFIKDFKCLKNFEAELNGHNVILLGDNEVGKSSLIQFIKICLGDQSCIPPRINGGGQIVVDIDGKPVTFKLTLIEGKPVIKVSGDGISIDNKKGAIAQLVGALSFDPDQFVRLSETTAGRKQQVEEFKKLLPIEIQQDLAKHEANIKNYYDQRTEINRDVTRLEGAVKTNPLYNHVHELDKFQPVDISAVMTERDNAQKNNANIQKANSELAICDKQIEASKKEIAELQAKIDAHNAVIDAQIDKINKGKEWLKTHSEISTAQFDTQIASASEINKKAVDAENLKKQMKEIEDLKNQSGELTVMIDSSKQLIQDAIRDIDGPIEDLTFDAEQLYFKGTPVHPASLSTSTISQLAVMLKRAENPKMPILLECSESWGQKKFDWLKELSKTEGFQFIAERVESGKEKLELRILVDEQTKN